MSDTSPQLSSSDDDDLCAMEEKYLATHAETAREDPNPATVTNPTKVKSKKVATVPQSPQASPHSPHPEENPNEMNTDVDFAGLLSDPAAGIFVSSNDTTHGWSYATALEVLQKHTKESVRRTAVGDIVAVARRDMKKQARNEERPEDETAESPTSDTSDCKETDSDSDDSVDDAHDNDLQGDVLTERSGNDPTRTTTQPEEMESDVESLGENKDAKIEASKAAKYFDTEAEIENHCERLEIFSQLNLSRPLLKGVEGMGFVVPTMIQKRVIPVALKGRDVCASAVTGSGKTAAFLLPIMERILQRGGGRMLTKANSKKQAQQWQSKAAILGMVLTPTRELAAQCLAMCVEMGKFTGLSCGLIVGGMKNMKVQAAELRNRPDIVIATPGRLLDHLTNSHGVDIDDLKFLVLDEADRLLDLGFQEEVHEIVKLCPSERQTMLFSATLGTKVEELTKLTLKQPIRIHVSDTANTLSADTNDIEVANRLEQEFVRVRSSHEGTSREAMLLALLTRTFTSRIIVFFDTKVAAHRLMIICGLCGINCTELHGNLTQVQRLEALEEFRKGNVQILLATDLAARGLDICQVEAVLNFEMPAQIDTYVHRIGRTARAGRAGKSCTLVGESRRILMKHVLKDAEKKRRTNSNNGIIRSRTIATGVISHFLAKIESLEPHIQEVITAEAVAKMDRIAEMEAMKVQNFITHSKEIQSRPKKEWFADVKAKAKTQETAKMKKQRILEKVGTGTHRMTRKKRRDRMAKQELKDAQEEDEESGVKSKPIMTEKAIKSSARTQKKQRDQQHKDQEEMTQFDRDVNRDSKYTQRTKRTKSSFHTDELDQTLDPVAEDSNHKDRPGMSHDKFKGFDPELRRSKKRPKQKSVNSFKSKKRFKRR